MLSIDELGSYLVVGAPDLVIGHLGGVGVDLPFLADVGTQHARLTREHSFRTGLSWRIRPIGGERVHVAGVALTEAGHALRHDERVELGVNLSFRYWHPDPGSTTAVLELQAAAECCGNRAIILQDEGNSGAVRLGRKSSCHLRLQTLASEMKLARSGSQLWIEGVRPLADRLERAGSQQRVRLDLPLDQRTDYQVGKASANGPACGVALVPLDRV